jgi:hypothetical protein
MASSLTSALNAAISEASRPLSRDLRRTASKTGWSAKETRGMKVTVKDGSMTVNAPDAALDREYGSAGRPPQAVIRKWANTSRAEGLVIATIERRLKKEGIL